MKSQATGGLLTCVFVSLVLVSCGGGPSVEQLVQSATRKVQQDQFDESVGDINLALARYQASTGSEREEAGKVLLRFAKMLQSSGKRDSSESTQRELENRCRLELAIREQVQGPEHPDVEQAAYFVAARLMTRYDHAEAEPLWRRLIVIRERRHIHRDPLLAQMKAHLAVICSGSNRFEEAEKLFKDLMAFHDSPPGSQPKDYRFACLLVAAFYNNYGKLAEAQAFRKKADEYVARFNASGTGSH